MSQEASASSLESGRALDDRGDAAGLGALFLRLIVGTVFFMNGTAVFGWFGGEGGVVGKEFFVDLLGYDPVTPVMWFLTITEIVTAVLLVLGFLTPVAVAGAIGIGFNLIFNLGWKQGFLGGEAGPGYVLAAVLSVAALSLALTGPGRYSVDRALGLSLHGIRWGIVAVVLGAGMGTVVLTAFGPGFGGFEPPAFP